MRPTLQNNKLQRDAANVMANYHRDVVVELETAVAQNEWVIVGMAGNPFVKKARNHLAAKNLNFKYIEHGSYLSKWKQRLAIKLWSGWPTFPQVFHKGTLIGGFNDLKKYLP